MGGPVRLKDFLELRVPVGISFKVRRWWLEIEIMERLLWDRRGC